MYKYFQKIGSTENLSSMKSKGLSDEMIKPPATSNNSLSQTLKILVKECR